MDSIVLDASAVLAVLQQEKGDEQILAAIELAGEGIAISSVNFCEVVAKLVREGASPAEVARGVAVFRPYVVDFTLPQSERAGELYRNTKSLGLSLGDRACLALAEATNATAWTTDRAWKKLRIDVKIELVRGSS
ncbi:MAG: type II toxin-antitoxin system VapC family toxin [Acidobacteriaceae bacterium]